MGDLYHECGVVAVCHLAGSEVSPLVPLRKPSSADPNASAQPDREQTARLVPRLLLDIQNRGQLAAGMTSYSQQRSQILNTHKNTGQVNEVFHLNQKPLYESLMSTLAGPAAIGHVRYATCGIDDPSYAHPFERPHIEKPKWFSFVFNGQLANYQELRQEILSQSDFHLSRETDTEVIMHLLCQELAGTHRPALLDVLKNVSRRMDGAYTLAFLNAQGDMFVARDPLGIRPMCIAREGALFAAASESVALANLGFKPASIQSLPPGHAVIIRQGQMSIERFAESPRRARCFFEWIYFANVASSLDERSVYWTRKSLGEELAELERRSPSPVIGDDVIVVPVPDTARAAADGMGYALGLPCLEGLIRNRYVGRTFIESNDRADKVRAKFTPLPEVFSGKRILLVEDSIVRSTTMKGLIHQIRDRGGAKEVHVRVACPPIVAPCFYGIDMSTVDELFAPQFLKGGPLTPEAERQMAARLGADSLHYLPIESIARAVDSPAETLCQACLTGQYPTAGGERLYQLALTETRSSDTAGRTYEKNPLVGARL